jgi:NADH:ubiquinone oxidoreductase subunit 6 (subunit J)
MLTNIINWLVALLRFLLVDNWPITLTVFVGFIAVYALLPRPHPAAPKRTGLVTAAVALLFAGTFIVRAGGFSAETVLFYAFSGIAVIAGGLLVTQSNPARAALSFALVVLSTCGLFLLLAAPFLMAATVIIYAGAIIVTFLFVIMLAQQEGLSDADQRSREPLLSSLTGFVLLGALLYVLQTGYGTGELDDLLARVRQAKGKPTVQDMAIALGDAGNGNREFFDRFRGAILKGGETAGARQLDEQVTDLQFRWMDVSRKHSPQDALTVCNQLEDIGLRARATYGALRPGEGPGAADMSAALAADMSPFSGPPSAVAPFGSPGKAAPVLRRDAEGRPQLPHENTAYLGRSLFTDYLLAVELGGTLLLVATVGAIAIAHRRGRTHA